MYLKWCDGTSLHASIVTTVSCCHRPYKSFIVSTNDARIKYFRWMICISRRLFTFVVFFQHTGIAWLSVDVCSLLLSLLADWLAVVVIIVRGVLSIIFPLLLLLICYFSCLCTMVRHIAGKDPASWLPSRVVVQLQWSITLRGYSVLLKAAQPRQ